MRSPLVWLVVAIVACLLSALGGCIVGSRQHRCLHTVPFVTTFGLGVEQSVCVDPTRPYYLDELITKLEPLPAHVNFVLVNDATGSEMFDLQKIIARNVVGGHPRRRLYGGEVIHFAHRDE